MSVLMSGRHAIMTTETLIRRVPVQMQTLDMLLLAQINNGIKVASALQELTSGSTRLNLMLVKKKLSLSPEIGRHQQKEEQEIGQ